MVSKKISILGTGDFARAFGLRALKSNYDVIMGSRDPSSRSLEAIDRRLSSIRVVDIDSCIKYSDIIIVAIRAIHYSTLSKFKEQLNGKVLVDVSNDTIDKKISNAEQLREYTDACVVKGFNVLSAWALLSESFGGSKDVFMCSDNAEAKTRVMQLARDIGFTPIDSGVLCSARDIEHSVAKIFPDWIAPTIFSWIMFLIFTLWPIVKMLKKETPNWRNFALKRLNSPVCATAIFLLACCYLPGELAAFYQLYYGNKIKRFPNWLDRWMKARKQIGLWAFFFATFHVIMSFLVLSAGSPSKFFRVKEYKEYDVRANMTIKVPEKRAFDKDFELMLFAGVVAYIFMAILAISTIPSIIERLNWHEFVVIQSYLGYFTLTTGVIHILIYGFPRWIIKADLSSIVRSFTFISSVLPLAVLLLKIILLLPCLFIPLRQIRAGNEVHFLCQKKKKTKKCPINYEAVTSV